ncbi:GDSL-type esterase/lipase family protein [Porticoccaceae bacterium]|nr:GDSL-type esterase/lipase family protein [Porticoccaceae bacterium]MDA9090924.1 GDSL-type esterase/lipase family protein [Porticoccaceae bacterium]
MSQTVVPCIPEILEPWWEPRHQSKLDELKQMQASPDILLVGDSITHVWEDSMGSEVDAKPIWNDFFSKYRTFNIGYCSDRTENVLWRLQNGEVDGISPKVAILLIGTNNTGIRQDPAEETAVGIASIINDLNLRLPTTKVLLLAIFPRTDNADYHHINTKINKIICRQYAHSNGVCYLDINDNFFEEKTQQFTKGFLPDGVHLTEDGYRIWAEAMKPTLMKMLA